MSKGKQMTAKSLIKEEKMELELGAIINGFEAILSLANLTGVKVMTAHKIARAYKQIRREVEKFEEYKDELRKEFATLIEDKEKMTKRYDFGENMSKVDKMIKDKMMTKVSMSLATISSSELEGVDVKPSTIADLDFLLVE